MARPTWIEDETFIEWLLSDARYEMDQLTWGNMLAQWSLQDDTTTIIATPKEVGLE